MKILEGGEGSGNYGHAGRPGEIGGSSNQHYDEYDIGGVRVYTGQEGKRINETLRYDTGKYSGIIDQIDKAINKSEIPEDMTLYRIMGTGYYSTEIGNTFSDKAFVSTTKKEEILSKLSVMGPKTKPMKVIIKVKRGQKGLVTIPDMVNYPEEQEVILPRNSKFRVTGYDANAMVHYGWGDSPEPVLYLKLL